MKKLIEPMFLVQPFEGTNITVVGYGRNNGITNWKTIVDGPFGGEPRNKMARSLKAMLRKHRISFIFAPQTSSFNATAVVSFGALNRTQKCGVLSIHTGEPVEGISVPSQSVAVFFPADCNTIIARAKSGNLIAAHAGGFSLIDHVATIGDTGKSRKFRSVVDAVIARFGELGDMPETLSVFIVRGVRDSNFGYDPRDETFGERNQKILATFRAIDPSVVVGQNGGVDITHAIRLQFERHDVPGERIRTDTTDTYNDRDFGGFTWWSHERAMTNGDKKEAGECRNLIAVLNP